VSRSDWQQVCRYCQLAIGEVQDAPGPGECTCTVRESDPWSITDWRPLFGTFGVYAGPAESAPGRVRYAPCPEHGGSKCRCTRCYGCRRVIRECECLVGPTAPIGPTGLPACSLSGDVLVTVGQCPRNPGRLAVLVLVEPETNQEAYRDAFPDVTEWTDRLLQVQGPASDDPGGLRTKLLRAHACGTKPQELAHQVEVRAERILRAIALGRADWGEFDWLADSLGLPDDKFNREERQTLIALAHDGYAAIEAGRPLQPGWLIDLGKFRSKLYGWRRDTKLGRALRGLRPKLPNKS
jgi:hypothetical protein